MAASDYFRLNTGLMIYSWFQLGDCLRVHFSGNEGYKLSNMHMVENNFPKCIFDVSFRRGRKIGMEELGSQFELALL